MAFVAPTFAITGSTATVGQAATITATITANNSDTVGFKVKRVKLSAGDYPVGIGKNNILMQAGGYLGGSAGTSAATTPTDYVLNAGSAAVTLVKCPIVFHKAGTATISAFMEITNATTGDRYTIAADADLTVTVS